METIQLKEIKYGEEDTVWWISLGFKSDLYEYDVLHIVLGKEIGEQNEDLGMDGLYIERFDQAYSCYKGIRSLVIKSKRVEIQFSEVGQEKLSFPDDVLFDASNVLMDYRGAQQIFTEMHKTKRANEISFAQQGHSL